MARANPARFRQRLAQGNQRFRAKTASKQSARVNVSTLQRSD